MNRKLSILKLIGIVGLFGLAALIFGLPSQKALAESCKSRPTVRLNDTLDKIARKYKVPPTTLIQVNKLVGPDYPIYVGQKLCIPPTQAKGATWKVEPFMTHPAGSYIIELPGAIKVFIKTANFAPLSSYRVWMESHGGKLMPIGSFITGKSGNTSVTFTLTREEMGIRARAKVCIQDSMGTVMLCRNVFVS